MSLSTARGHHRRRLAAILKGDPTQIEVRDRNSLTPLLFAATEGDTAIMKLLLSEGADVNAIDSLTGQNALHYSNGNLQAAKLLAENGIDLELMDRRGQTPLRKAADEAYDPRCRAVYNFLLKLGVANDIESAVQANDLKGVRSLLKSDPELISRLPVLEHAVLMYCALRKPEILEELLKSGGNPNIRTRKKTGSEGLFYAPPIFHASVDKSIELLLKYGADPNLLDAEGRTALDLAKKFSMESKIEMLNGHGAKTSKELISTKRKSERSANRKK